MTKIDALELWSLDYRLLMLVITGVAPQVSELGLEVKELFVLSEIDDHPHPAELAAELCMPKPTVTLNLKRLEAAGFVKREIDPGDLRKHRLLVTPAGRKVMTKGLSLLSDAFSERLANLSATEQSELRSCLRKMVAPPKG